MPLRCLVCRNHKSVRRRLCSLCYERRALPFCWPEACWIPKLKACRDCAHVLLTGRGLPQPAARIILDYLATPHPASRGSRSRGLSYPAEQIILDMQWVSVNIGRGQRKKKAKTKKRPKQNKRLPCFSI